MNLSAWAKRWGIADEALEDLKTLFGIAPTNVSNTGISEAGIQNLIRLEASKKGARLWRNNVGATYTQEGNFLRYGLANESTNMNRVIKSADLIGIKPVKITKEMIGFTIGQFVSREVKHASWRYSANNLKETAQLKWAELIMSLGGDACFANGEGTL